MMSQLRAEGLIESSADKVTFELHVCSGPIRTKLKFCRKFPVYRSSTKIKRNCLSSFGNESMECKCRSFYTKLGSSNMLKLENKHELLTVLEWLGAVFRNENMD